MDKKSISIAALLLLISLTVFYLTVSRVDLSRTYLFNLEPEPDACEYYAMATSIAKNGKTLIKIGYDELPSRYSIGFPLLITPWIDRNDQFHNIFAPFRTVQTFSLFLILIVWFFYVRINNLLKAGVASLFLATMPCFISFARSPLSEIPAIFCLIAAFMLTYYSIIKRSFWIMCAAAILLGVGINIRLQLIFFSPILLAVTGLHRGPIQITRKLFLHSLSLMLILLISICPTLVYNYLHFGNILKNGYHYWVNAMNLPGFAFNTNYLVNNMVTLADQVIAGGKSYNVANAFGTGSYIVMPFLLLALLGIFYIRINAFSICAFISGTIYSLGSLLFVYNDARMFSPIFILIIAIATVPVANALKEILDKRLSIVNITIITLFILSIIGMPSLSGFPVKEYNIQLASQVNWTYIKSNPCKYIAAMFLKKLNSGTNCLVLSDINPVYLSTILDDRSIVAPIDDKNNYCHSRYFHYGTREATSTVRRAISESRVVYALKENTNDMSIFVTRLPSINKYTWRPVCKNNTEKVLVMRLEKN
jgi:hypothetical protein